MEPRERIKAATEHSPKDNIKEFSLFESTISEKNDAFMQ
jgi:hypothetical protein